MRRVYDSLAEAAQPVYLHASTLSQTCQQGIPQLQQFINKSQFISTLKETFLCDSSLYYVQICHLDEADLTERLQKRLYFTIFNLKYFGLKFCLNINISSIFITENVKRIELA